MTVDALLFDIGGVIIDIDFECAFRSWAAAAGVSSDTMRARFAFDEPYECHERGEITAVEYFAALRSSLQVNLSDAALAAGWNAIHLNERPGIRALLRTAAERFPLYAFTNSNPVHQAFLSTALCRRLEKLSQDLRFVRDRLAKAGAGSLRSDRVRNRHETGAHPFF